MLKDKKGVFGLTAVQGFFVIILAIALLAYIIVIIMGTLSNTSVLPSSSGSAVNESVKPTDAGTALSGNAKPNCQATITTVLNNSGLLITSGNYSVSGCTITNLTSTFSTVNWNVTYTYSYDSQSQQNTKGILTNTSVGITAFFGAINPVYAILAVLVIILVLIVLVRVVQAPAGREVTPQL